MKRRSVEILLLLLLLVLMAVMTVSASADTFAQDATPLEIGDNAITVPASDDAPYYSLQSTGVGQILQMKYSNNSGYANFRLFDSTGECIDTSEYSYTYYGYLPTAGTYYVQIIARSGWSGNLNIQLIDGDSYEPNNSQETATKLTDGQKVELSLMRADEDWLMIETTEDGQDVQVDIGGFTYANKGQFYLEFDGVSYSDDEHSYSMYIKGNGTHYFHAATKGKHYIRLYSGSNTADQTKPLAVTVTATVLDGDSNECNDTQATATTLSLGTDASFSVGGWGDEDWFKFEAVPASSGKSLYTLQFLGLNPDYSDRLYYEVYAPDGSLVVERTYININHSLVMECSQQGQYSIRILTVKGKNGEGFGVDQSYYSAIKQFTRSTLRLRVTQGGSDPHENNDTWLTAAPIQVGQLTQHVLSSITDTDWFWFTAPEADMSFALEMSRNTQVALYSAAALGEHGEDASYNIFSRYDSYANFYCKLPEAGVYYLKLTTSSSYASSDLRSFTVNLTSPGSEENNDTYAKAVRLYDSVPQSFDIAGFNDEDWFKIVLTEDASVELTFTRTKYYGDSLHYSLFGEEDFESIGLNAAAVVSGGFSNKSGSDIVSLQAGTYYLKVGVSSWNYYQYSTGCTVTYTASSGAGGFTLETAIALEPGKWSECLTGDRYYSLGQLNAGDTIHISRDGSGHYPYVQLLYGSDGTSVRSIYDANGSMSVSKTCSYYLFVQRITYNSYDNYSDYHDLNDELHGTRIQYTVSSSETTAKAIEGPDAITLYAGTSQFVALQLNGGTSGDVNISSYGSSNYNVAAYDRSTGYIEAKTAGTATITVGAYVDGGSLTKTIEVTVLESPTATGIAIANAPASMTLGEKVYLTASLTPEGSNDAVTWSSSDSKILYVFPGGKTVAVGEGTATVTAKCGELSATAQITVQAGAATESQITSLLLDSYSLTMYLGEETQKLTATVQPAGIDAAIAWTSSNSAAATVDQTGTVTAVAPGISIITAAAGDHNVSCVVTVQAARVRVTGISFESTTLQLPLGGETTLVPTITPDNATTRTLTWVSDDPSVATVSRTGIVHGLAVGKTTIRATTLDGGFVAELELEVTAKAQRGDINGDGYVDAADAMLCLQNAVGLIELTEEQLEAGDVNNDGVVDAGDAIKILRYNVGLIETLD